jgi:hypothetical protein
MADEEKPLREMDMAMLSALELLIDVMLRAGVPREEFEQQFQHALRGLDEYPNARHIMDGLRKIMHIRADGLGELLKTKLRDEPPQGTA